MNTGFYVRHFYLQSPCGIQMQQYNQLPVREPLWSNTRMKNDTDHFQKNGIVGQKCKDYEKR